MVHIKVVSVGMEILREQNTSLVKNKICKNFISIRSSQG
jgi:hypothetical protein